MREDVRGMGKGDHVKELKIEIRLRKGEKESSSRGGSSHLSQEFEKREFS